MKRKTRGLVEMVSVSLPGVFLLLGFFVGLGLHRFAEAVALAVHLEDLAPVREAFPHAQLSPWYGSGMVLVWFFSIVNNLFRSPPAGEFVAPEAFAAVGE